MSEKLYHFEIPAKLHVAIPADSIDEAWDKVQEVRKQRAVGEIEDGVQLAGAVHAYFWVSEYEIPTPDTTVLVDVETLKEEEV